MEIKIKDAYEKNLKHINLNIPRNKLSVITGLSGSGKTTLLKDVIYTEAQRQYLETMNYQGIPKPKVEEIRNLSPAILIDQEDKNDNPRSTLGTQTDIYTDLRMLFEKLHQRTCPNCRAEIYSSDSIEETEKVNDKFKVYMYCPNCNYRMEKLTRSHFSFNTKAGACPTCKGIGKQLNIKNNLYRKNKTILNGAVVIWPSNYADYQLKSFNALLDYLDIPIPRNIPLGEFTYEQFDVLKRGIHSEQITADLKSSLPSKVAEGRFEGVETKIWGKIAEEKTVPQKLKDFVQEDICLDCNGEKLNCLSRSVTVQGFRLPEIDGWDLKQILNWIQKIKKSDNKIASLVSNYILDIETKITRLNQLGLSYLSLNREYGSLSGGEAQRIKLAAVLDSKMTELIIILDEPSIGLHPSDIEGLLLMINAIKRRNNTVLIIEHDEALIKQADYIIEIGPESGAFGGKIISSGTYNELLNDSKSLLFQSKLPNFEQTSYFRNITNDAVKIKGANKNNLKNVALTLPANCLTVITGVSGSGKSSLLFDEIAVSQLKDNQVVQWEEKFKDIIVINQKRPTRNKRSVIATYLDIFKEIRVLFGKKAKELKLPFSATDFSFNSGHGRCPECLGLGAVESNNLFFENTTLTCQSCFGKRYKEEILNVKINNYSISDILDLSINEAIQFFEKHNLNSSPLALLKKTNLSYISLGQATDTLSGGEMQRLSLASVISKQKSNKYLFILDEPTIGMHKMDIYHFMVLIQQLVEEENTFLFIEHNIDVIKQADYIVELGPSGGNKGGEIIFHGSISKFFQSNTISSRYLI